jgi:hypothetical protein
MNYAVVILVFVLLLSTLYWFIHGRTYYKGPLTHAHVEGGHVVNDDKDGIPDQEKAVVN